MIYLLAGPDEFRIREKVSLILAEMEDSQNQPACHWLEGDKLSVDELDQALLAQSLLFTQRSVVIKNLLTAGLELSQNWLEEWLTGPELPGVTVVLIEATALTAKSRWQKYAKNWHSETYPLLSPAESITWINQQAQKRGINLSAAAARQLANNFGDDLWRLSNELDKLALWAGANLVTPEMLAQIVTPILPDNIFQAVDALARRELAAANLAINRQLAVGANETELLAMVAYQFRNIVLLKALLEDKVAPDKLAAKTGLHPYVVKKSLSFARSFSWTQLQRIFYLLQKVDTAMKSSQTPPRVGLDILVAQIMQA